MSTKAILKSTKNLSRGLVTLSLALGAVAPSAFAADTAASAKPTAPVVVTTERLQETVGYLQSVPTVGELIAEMHQLGALSKEEETSLEGFMTAQKIDLKAAIPSMEVSGLTVKMKTASLTWQADGSIKTQSGRLLHDTAGQAKDAMVIETFKTLAEKPGSYSLLKLFVPNADAQSFYPQQSPLDDIFGGLIRLGNTIGESLAIPLCALTVAPTDAALTSLRQGLHEGSVVCRGGEFGFVGYAGLVDRANADAARGRNGPPMSLSRELDGSFNAVCQAPFDRNNGAPDNRAHFRAASPDLVSQAFRGRHPRCTPRTAHELDEYAKGHFRRVDREIVRHHRGGDDLPPRQGPPGDLGGDVAQ